DESLIETLVEVEQFVLDLEPKVREVNRVLVPLFGKCPSSEDGSWAYIAKDDNDQYFIAFECLPANKAFGLVARLAEVLALVEDANSHVRARDSYQPDLGHVIVGDVAQFNVVPHTHVRVVRKS
ncbi:MAG: hypothetical protein ACK48T_02415, partial [Acidimicrobiaceae bacterium]